MNMKRSYIFWIVYFCICYNNAVYGSSFSESNHCIRRNYELICNHIPKDIPGGMNTVILKNVVQTELRKGNFLTDNWGQLKNLEITATLDWLVEHNTIQIFNSFCFAGLKNLEVLRIGISQSITFSRDCFNGLENLKRLDLTGCRRLYLEDVLNAIKNRNVLPNLQNLSLALLNNYRIGINLDERFFKIISAKKVKVLDVSSTQIIQMNITAFIKYCQNLEALNISGATVNDFEFSRDARQSCPKLTSFDASYVTFPTNMFPLNGRTKITERNANVPLNFNWMKSMRFLNHIRYINLTGILPKLVSYSFENLTVYVFGADIFKFKVLSFSNNHVDRIDVKLIIPGITLEKLDLSGCDTHYIHPDAISGFHLLSDINLSKNNLYSMMAEDPDLFEKMFKNLTNLRFIGLASNGLISLPKDMFVYNLRLEYIDLADNMILGLSFEIGHFNHLTTDFTNNKIQVLDNAKLKTLDNVHLLLNGNPIMCSECNSLTFIEWLKNSESNNVDLKCRNKNSRKVIINDKVINEIHEICNRPKIIVLICFFSVLTMISLVAIIFKMHRYQRQRKYKLKMEERIALIREGVDDNNFVVFLSYSSCDEDFINRYVYNQLNENLQHKIGQDRNLICEGDKHFQIGRPIPEQMSRFLHRSSVVIVVLTDDFIQSVHCRNELEQALLLEKPIVLMVKDEINKDLMTCHMRDLYEKKTRIIFALENREYVLKTSWENICTSIIELVQN